MSCDEGWTTLTIPKLAGNPWKAAESHDGASTCTVPSGNVDCTLESQPVHALVITASKDVPVGSTTNVTLSGLPGGVTQTVAVVFDDE